MTSKKKDGDSNRPRHGDTLNMQERMSGPPWPDGLLLGRPVAPRTFGFNSPNPRNDAKKTRYIRADGHGVVFAATGAGKFTACIAGNTLTFGGSQLIIIDPKGEIAAVTARARRAMGEVFIIDPFEVLGPETASLNPLDILALKGMGPEDTADSIAHELSNGKSFERDPFWHDWAASVVGGMVASVALDPDPAKRTFNTVTDLLTSDDVVCNLAIAMDRGEIRGDFAKRRVGGFLALPDGGGSTRGGVLGSIQHIVACLMGPRVRRCLEPSSFELADLVSGSRPITIYLVFPPTRALAYAGLLRLWMATLLHTLSARPSIPEHSTMVIVDEAANLGKLDLLPVMYSFGRGQGVTMLTVWQSLGQMMSCFPADWRTIVENAGAIQCFGLHHTAIDPLASLLGQPASTLRDLKDDQQLVARCGRDVEVIERIDYRADPVLAALADPNPRYERRAGKSSSQCLDRHADFGR